MKHVRRLDKASSIFFFFALICAKVRIIPVFFLWPIFNSAMLFFNLLGNSVWLAASLLRPGYKRKKQSWYGFAQFKNQHKVAATLGIIATVLSIAAIAFPILLVPASWLFVLGNCFWCVAEYHKINNPPDDANYSPGRQKIYLRFALLMTAAGILGALATTATFCFPPIALPVIVFTTVIAILLNFCALHQWIKCNTYHYGPDAYKHSYRHMTARMPKIENNLTVEPAKAPLNNKENTVESDAEPESTLDSACNPTVFSV